MMDQGMKMIAVGIPRITNVENNSSEEIMSGFRD
jgi:hypothetical protein